MDKENWFCELYLNVNPSNTVLFVRQVGFLQFGYYNQIEVMFCQDGVRRGEFKIRINI